MDSIVKSVFSKSVKSYIRNQQGGSDLQGLLILFGTSFGLCYIAYVLLANSMAKKNNNKQPTFSEIMGLDRSKFKDYQKAVLVGMVGNFIFGFIDNAGLFYGMSYLDPYMKYMPLAGGKETENTSNVKAGFGNTYSDLLGMFLGTFIGKSIELETGVSDTPLWAQIIGIVLGCLFGVYIPLGINMMLGSGTEPPECPDHCQGSNMEDMEDDMEEGMEDDMDGMEGMRN